MRRHCQMLSGGKTVSISYLVTESKHLNYIYCLRHAQLSLFTFYCSTSKRNINTEQVGNLETDAESSTNSAESIEYYRANPAYPVFSSSRKVLPPEKTVRLLTENGGFEHTAVCHIQPLLVEHNRTFIVDLSSLKSPKNIKCDDMGTWRNNSSHKFGYSIGWDELKK